MANRLIGGNDGRLCRYERMSWITLGLGFVLIVFGAVVRVAGAGMGCGPDWPDCNGEVVPNLRVVETAIEYTHRLIAAGVGLLTVALVLLGRRLRPLDRAFVVLPAWALGLVVAQSLLGALTVAVELSPPVVAAHLGMAEAYFAVLIATVVVVRRVRHPHSPLGVADVPPPVARAALLTAVLVFLVLLSGAYTSTSGAGYACPEWPFCAGRFVPTGWTVVDINLTHRWFVVLAAASVGWLAVASRRTLHRGDPARVLIGIIAVLMVVQVLSGAVTVWLRLQPWASALHLALATLTWGVLVTLLAVERRGVHQRRLSDQPAASRPVVGRLNL